MSEQEAPIPEKPAKRPAHRGQRAVRHHVAHRRRLLADAQAHRQAKPPKAPPQ
jgi:hypothetical protein